MSYYLTDTHCHITCDRLYQRIDEIMANAQAANIKRLIQGNENKFSFHRKS